MGFSHSLNSSSHNKLHHYYLTISFIFLLISSWTQLRFIVEGRTIFRPIDHSQGEGEGEEKAMLRGQIGSRPPRCERRRCGSCGGHCEAIQVPTNPQINNNQNHNNYNNGRTRNSSSSSSSISTTMEYYNRGDGNSNYKPMSWKCKCGNSIFNP